MSADLHDPNTCRWTRRDCEDFSHSGSDYIASLREQVAALTEQLACVRQALPEALRNSVPSVAVATMAAGMEHDAAALAALTRERDALRAELDALKGQEPVYWQWRRKCDAWELGHTYSYEPAVTTDDSEKRALYAAPTPAAADAEAPVWECKAGGLKPLTQAQYEAQPARIQRHYTRIAHTREAICAALLVGLPLSADQRASLLVMLRTAGDAEALRAQFITAADLADLTRLEELFSDDEGWDLPKARMQRLAQIGVIRRSTGNIYGFTSFGMWCLGLWPDLPLMTAAEANAAAAAKHRAALAADAGRAKTEGGE